MTEVGGGDGRVRRVELEGDEPSALRQRTGEPDRAVAAQRAELEDAPRASHASEQVEKLPLGRAHLNGGESGGLGRAQGVLERGVLGHEQLLEVAIDVRERRAAHARECTADGQERVAGW